jgi:hypothetical protein
MSEENQNPKEVGGQLTVEEVEKKYQEQIQGLTSELEQTKKIAQGQDKKNSELFEEIERLKKTVGEKEEVKKSIEDKFNDLVEQLAERDKLAAKNEKKAIVNRIIAENGLDPEYDFDYLFKFETEESISQKAVERKEKYLKLKEDGFKERAKGSVPNAGAGKGIDLKTMSIDELNKLSFDQPELTQDIIQELKTRK